MASSAATIAQLTDTSLSECAFISKVSGDAYMGFATVGSGGGVLNVNIIHSASFSTGYAIALYFVFFV